jgi:hypothetical protein
MQQTSYIEYVLGQSDSGYTITLSNMGFGDRSYLPPPAVMQRKLAGMDFGIRFLPHEGGNKEGTLEGAPHLRRPTLQLQHAVAFTACNVNTTKETIFE